MTVNPTSTGALASYIITSALWPTLRWPEVPAPSHGTGRQAPSSRATRPITPSPTPPILQGLGPSAPRSTWWQLNDVTLTVPEGMSAGDQFSITVQDVINPGTANATDTISVVGGVTGYSSSSGNDFFPDAEVSYPNGSIVNFSGTDYVFAGGHAFQVTGSSQLTALQKVDHASVRTATAGATPPTASPRSGTLVFTRPVNGNATIYVAGTDGDLHGFATPAQFLGDGYDAALVVTVTSLTGLTVGKTAGSQGAAANALATSADGAIVQSSGAYYVFAGGRAFGVPNPTSLTTIRKADKAKTLSGTVTSATTSATVANGAWLVTSGVVYVSYGGDLWPFGSQAQLATDGYGGHRGLAGTELMRPAMISSYGGH